MLDAMIEALHTRDVARIAALATASARSWQAISPKADLDTVIALAGKLGALGVINTHSGTYLGLLFPDDPALDQPRLAAVVAEQFPSHGVAWYATTGCDTAMPLQFQQMRRSLG